MCWGALTPVANLGILPTMVSLLQIVSELWSRYQELLAHRQVECRIDGPLCVDVCLCTSIDHDGKDFGSSFRVEGKTRYEAQFVVQLSVDIRGKINCVGGH